MLGHDDVELYCKRVLLEKVARAKCAPEWFEGSGEVLANLEGLDDAKLSKWLRAVNGQLVEAR